LQLTTRSPRDAIALFVDCTVVTTAQKREIGQRGGAAGRPVVDMVALGDASFTAREAAGTVAMKESASQGRWNGAGSRPNLDQASILVVAHHDPARVTGQALRRFRGNACAVFEDRLARLVRIRERRSIDVDHYLIALARRSRIEVVVERRLGE
jgi:hypothetical protein